jgi:hypothetical protein
MSVQPDPREAGRPARAHGRSAGRDPVVRSLNLEIARTKLGTLLKGLHRLDVARRRRDGDAGEQLQIVVRPGAVFIKIN